MHEHNDASWLPEEIQQDLDDPTRLQEYNDGVDLLRGAMARSTTDLEFRRQLLETPRTVLAAFYRERHGQPLPGCGDDGIGVDIRFLENEGDITFVLPSAINVEEELSDTELEAVAGGGGVFATVGVAMGFTQLVCVGIVAGAIVGMALVATD